MSYVKVLFVMGGVVVLGMLGAQKLRAQPSPVDCDRYAQDYARTHSRNGQVLRGAGGGALLGAGIGALAGGAGAGAGAYDVRPMLREYTITRTMHAWLVVRVSDFKSRTFVRGWLYEKN